VSDFENRPPGGQEDTTTPAAPSAPSSSAASAPTSPDGSRDPYEVLGVTRDATQEDIRAAYERFARYPELWGGSDPGRAERLQRIEAAYRLLSDPERRAAYDRAWAGEESVYTPSGARRGSWNPVDRMTRNLPRPWRIAIDWAVTIIGAILIVLALKQWIVNPYRIPSSSMEPTLHCARPGPGCQAHFSDRVLACRICLDFSSPSRGDIIVFKTPPAAADKCGEGGTFVKRLIGLPGETVSERNGFVYIDGKPLKEPYIERQNRDNQTGKWTVPPGQYFFMGDNRAQSCDSRQWGSVPRGNLIGEVFFVYWPPNRIGFR
jgi:signal peptidase I